jgi:hypothetical protein
LSQSGNHSGSIVASPEGYGVVSYFTILIHIKYIILGDVVRKKVIMKKKYENKAISSAATERRGMNSLLSIYYRNKLRVNRASENKNRKREQEKSRFLFLFS